MQQPDSTWGARLAAQMAIAGMSGAALGLKIGVSRARVSELARSETPPKAATVLRLAAALGCRVSDLDPRLSDEAYPQPGSRLQAAAAILESRFGLVIEYIRTSTGHFMICRRDPSDPDPTAIVSGPNDQGRFGCLAVYSLQSKIFAALNPGAGPPAE